MKPFVVGLLLCLPLAAGSATQLKYGVTVTAQKNVDYAKLKSYSWYKGIPAANESVDRQIVAAIDRELKALGMIKVATAPDVLVTYHAIRRTDADPQSKPDASGRLARFTVGTLSVGFLDPANRRELLGLRLDKPLESAPPQTEDIIDTAVAELFTKYPTRQKK